MWRDILLHTGNLIMLITKILCWIVFKRPAHSKFFPMGSLLGMVREISGRIRFQNLDRYKTSDFVFGEKDDNEFALQEHEAREIHRISFYFVNTLGGGKLWPLPDMESSVLAFNLGRLETPAWLDLCTRTAKLVIMMKLLMLADMRSREFQKSTAKVRSWEG